MPGHEAMAAAVVHWTRRGFLEAIACTFRSDHPRCHRDRRDWRAGEGASHGHCARWQDRRCRLFRRRYGREAVRNACGWERQVPDPGPVGHARPHVVRGLVPAREGGDAAAVHRQRHHGRARHGRGAGSAAAVAEGNRGRDADGATHGDLRTDARWSAAAFP